MPKQIDPITGEPITVAERKRDTQLRNQLRERLRASRYAAEAQRVKEGEL